MTSAEGYTPPDAIASEYQSIPLNKIEDSGVHANQYYPLKKKAKNDGEVKELSTCGFILVLSHARRLVVTALRVDSSR